MTYGVQGSALKNQICHSSSLRGPFTVPSLPLFIDLPTWVAPATCWALSPPAETAQSLTAPSGGHQWWWPPAVEWTPPCPQVEAWQESHWGRSNPCSAGGILQPAEQNSWPGHSPSEGPDAAPESAVGPEVLRRHSCLKSLWTLDFPGALCKAAQLLPDPAPPGCKFFQKKQNETNGFRAERCPFPQDQKAWPAGPGCSPGGVWEKLLVPSSDKASQRALEQIWMTRAWPSPLRTDSVRHRT